MNKTSETTHQGRMQSWEHRRRLFRNLDKVFTQQVLQSGRESISMTPRPPTGRVAPTSVAAIGSGHASQALSPEPPIHTHRVEVCHAKWISSMTSCMSAARQHHDAGAKPRPLLSCRCRCCPKTQSWSCLNRHLALAMSTQRVAVRPLSRHHGLLPARSSVSTV